MPGYICLNTKRVKLQVRYNNNDMKNNVIVVFLVVLVLGLILWSRFTSPDYRQVKEWNSFGVDCLPSGHQNLGQHIHPDLFITIDEEQVVVPANIGINAQCMAELHTHDVTGKIHIETVAPDKEMTLEQFFQMWGETIEKEGYNLQVTIDSVTVDYAENSDIIKNHILKDLEQIKLDYKSA